MANQHVGITASVENALLSEEEIAQWKARLDNLVAEEMIKCVEKNEQIEILIGEILKVAREQKAIQKKIAKIVQYKEEETADLDKKPVPVGKFRRAKTASGKKLYFQSFKDFYDKYLAILEKEMASLLCIGSQVGISMQNIIPQPLQLSPFGRILMRHYTTGSEVLTAKELDRFVGGSIPKLDVIYKDLTEVKKWVGEEGQNTKECESIMEWFKKYQSCTRSHLFKILIKVIEGFESLTNDMLIVNDAGAKAEFQRIEEIRARMLHVEKGCVITKHLNQEEFEALEFQIQSLRIKLSALKQASATSAQ